MRLISVVNYNMSFKREFAWVNFKACLTSEDRGFLKGTIFHQNQLYYVFD